MIRFRFIFPLLLIALFFSCSDDGVTSTESPVMGFQYIPLTVGKELVYQVDSISYDEFTESVDTTVFYIKEVIEEKFNDLEGYESYLVGVYRRESDTISWTKKRNITKKIVGRRYETLENNLIRIPLVFPLSEETTWDVNVLNTAAAEIYSLKTIHTNQKVNGVDYDSVIVVNQRDEENLIEQFLEEEKYAARVGLIQKRKVALQTELNGSIRNGTDVKINLISQN